MLLRFAAFLRMACTTIITISTPLCAAETNRVIDYNRIIPAGTINFVAAPPELYFRIFQEFTGKPVIIDSTVPLTNDIKFYLDKDVTARELIDLFIVVARHHGMYVFDEGSYYSVQNKNSNQWLRLAKQYVPLSFACHLAIWAVLLLAYPYSPKVQATFFWNPRIRQVLGLGYIGTIAVWVPFIRKRLLQPMNDSLLGQAELTKFEVRKFYAELNCSVGQQASVKLHQFKPSIGQFVIEGPSGAGKTEYLRFLLLRDTHCKVFLRARECNAGVLDAIAKLIPLPVDFDFLASLVHSRGINVYIDGLNEVSVETRLRIVDFANQFKNCHVIITTQPMDWTPPAWSVKIAIHPLDKRQAMEFLLTREPNVSTEPFVAADYECDCNRFLETIDLNSISPNDMVSWIMNPMDLSIASILIGKSIVPIPLQLVEQYVSLVEAEYARINQGRKLPLRRFSERLLQLRLEDNDVLPYAEFHSAIDCMLRFKMVVQRSFSGDDGKNTTEFLLRHDRFADYFVGRLFEDESAAEWRGYLTDARFTGVFLGMAATLSLSKAMNLREEAIQHAVLRHDHVLSDGIIGILNERKSLAARELLSRPQIAP